MRKIIYRSQCDCLCHIPGISMMHFMQCCHPDPVDAPPLTDLERADIAEKRFHAASEHIKLLTNILSHRRKAEKP